jgi:type III restriction enzyme
LATAFSTLESAIGRPFGDGEVAHAFHDSGDIKIGDCRVRHIDASRIEEDPRVSFVIFKMSLSTGWDCPRAEVMMSFRRAQDHTYIAQLLGRMVRAPLARRIERDAALNDVNLYLPHYDEDTVNDVVKALKDVDYAPPTETGTSRELVTLQRRKGAEAIFDAIQNLETYRVNAVRKQSALRRLMALGRGLTHDRIDEETQQQVTQQIVTKMIEEVQRLHRSGDFEQCARQITGIDLKTITLQGTIVGEGKPTYTVEATEADIDRQFEQAGRLLSNGLHAEYWKANAEREARTVKVETIVLSQDHDGMRALEQYAEQGFNRLYEQHKREIAQLTEVRRTHYNRLRLATAEPQTIPWVLPDSIPLRRTPRAPVFERHLYLEQDGSFRADLGEWEKGVLAEELADLSVVAWLRNVDRQPWSLEIPYRYSGEIRPMFPDLMVVRKDSRGFQFDILEPHDPSLKDNFAKAVGLAEFAEKHWSMFARIQLIRKKRAADGKEHYYRLDVGKEAIRKKVLAISSNHELDQMFDEGARVRS